MVGLLSNNALLPSAVFELVREGRTDCVLLGIAIVCVSGPNDVVPLIAAVTDESALPWRCVINKADEASNRIVFETLILSCDTVGECDASSIGNAVIA